MTINAYCTTGLDELVHARWRKSTFSAASTNECIEVAGFVSGPCLIRDSKDRSGSVLTFSFPEWFAFITGIRSGEFD